MSSSKSEEHPINDFEQFVREALECPVCTDKIKSGPIYQCTNGHITCRNCIPKLESCPICRNNSTPVRNLKLEQIVQKLNSIQLENTEDTSNETPKNLNWKKGSKNQELNVQLSLRQNSNINLKKRCNM